MNSNCLEACDWLFCPALVRSCSEYVRTLIGIVRTSFSSPFDNTLTTRRGKRASLEGGEKKMRKRGEGGKREEEKRKRGENS